MVAVAMALSTTLAASQPALDPGTSQGRSGSINIPVTSGATEVMGAEREGSSSSPAPTPLEGPIDPNTYVCGPGDVFELNFWGQQNFRLRIAADVEGRTFISKVGFVEVSGKTLSDVRTQIKKKVRTNYPGLQFDLVLANPRSFLVHVVDNVKSPGMYPARAVERVSNVVAAAGGSIGTRRRISIRHKAGTTSTADLVRYELTGDTAQNPLLLDGDVVSVPAPGVTVVVNGAVRRPGTYELVTGDLAEAVELAGGLAPGVARTLPIRITRRNAQLRATFQEAAFEGTAIPSVRLADDDSVLVPSASELQRTVMLIGAVSGAESIDPAATLKRLPFVEGDTVRSLIERAGGIQSAGDLRRSYISRHREDKAPELIALDLEALLIRRDFSKDKPIKMNDTIVIPPMKYSISVEGAVTRAGFYPYNPSFGIHQYLALAGGRSRTARDLDDVRLIRPDGTTHPYAHDLKLDPGDSILVPERNFTRGEMVQIGLTVAGLVLSGVAVTLAATR